jgi:preprotein translocase subunit YajC
MQPLLFIFLMFIVMWFLLIRPQQREQAQRTAMIGGLKKGDRIVTIGGILGTIQAVHEHDLVVKIDEKSNTRVRLLKTAVHQCLTGDSAGKTDGGKKGDDSQARSAKEEAVEA